MAIKASVKKEAEKLNIEISDEDTTETLQGKINSFKEGIVSEGDQAKVAGKELSPSGTKRIKVNAEQLKKLQDEHKLIGYDPTKEEAIISA